MVDEKMLNEVKEAQRVVYYLTAEIGKEVVQDVGPSDNPSTKEVRDQLLLTEAKQQLEVAVFALATAFWKLRAVVPKPAWEK